MLAHLARVVILGAPFQELEHFPREVSDGVHREAEGPERLEFGDLVLQRLDAGGRGLRFQVLKRGLRRARRHDQELVKRRLHSLGEPSRDPLMDILKKAVQRRPHNPLQFLLSGQLNPQRAEAGIGAFTELFFGGCLWGGVRAEPGFEPVLILACRKAPPQVLPN